MSDSTRRRAALDQLIELVVRFNDDMTRSLTRDGLTASRAHLLWELAQRGPSTQRALADALGVSARNITGLVDALVATGFVVRRPHPTDRRATLVTFTERGAQVAEAFDDGHQQLAELLFAAMPDEQFHHFTQGVATIVDRLRAHATPPGPEEDR